MTSNSFYMLISVVLVFFLAIPPNTCILIVNLDSFAKKGKLNPSNVIFMAKGMVNLLLQGLMSLQGMFSVLCPEALPIGKVNLFINLLTYFLMYFSFWMTAWLSAHYCTTITKFSFGFFIWIKKIVSNYLSHVLFLTALVLSVVCVLIFFVMNDISFQSSGNSTDSFIDDISYNRSVFYYFASSILTCILPYCFSLLCLLLTFLFLVRHIWRVKNNDSRGSQPNLQAHVTALRTILFLLLMYTLVFMSRTIMFFRSQKKVPDPSIFVGWTTQLYFPSAEAAVMFQASNKLRRIIVRRFWTRSWRNTET